MVVFGRASAASFSHVVASPGALRSMAVKSVNMRRYIHPAGKAVKDDGVESSR